MDRIRKFIRIIQEIDRGDVEVDPVTEKLLLLGGLLFLVFMLLLLLDFDLFGLKDLMRPMSIVKCWLAAGICCLPGIVYGIIFDFLSKKEGKNAAN